MTEITDPPAYTPPELARAIEGLTGEFTGVHSPQTVSRVVVHSHMQLARTSTVTTYLPILASRFVRERLRAAASIEGLLMTDKPDVLFVCVRNTGRSQMAAGLLNHHADGAVLVRSAGSAPADAIKPAVVEAMNEPGRA